MDALRNILPTMFFEVLEKAGICTPKQIIILSIWDIKKVTNLINEDILLLKNIVSHHYSPICVGCDELEEKMCIKTGCSSVDKMLQGGFRRGVLTEIFGESGSGKTQIAIQSSVCCGDSGSVIICTEDVFPIKRFYQISENIRDSANKSTGENLFIEHLTESQDLLSCVRIRLPILLNKHRISVVIIDSVAAPFRCEHTNYVERAEELKELGSTLLNLAQEHNLAVICINQVTSSFNSFDDVLPTLGLVWSNIVTYRLKLTKLQKNIHSKSSGQYVNLRELTVVYAPDLPSGSSCNFIITPNCIEDVSINNKS